MFLRNARTNTTRCIGAPRNFLWAGGGEGRPDPEAIYSFLFDFKKPSDKDIVIISEPTSS
jgi:hypothetical protein